MTNSPQKLSPKVIIPMLILVVINLFSPVLISTRWNWLEGWAFGLSGLVAFIISRWIAARKNPDIIAERGNSFTHKDMKSFDKILAPLLGLFSALIAILAGIEAIQDSPPDFSAPVRMGAFVIMVTGYAYGSWALVVNKFFSGVVRIQNDRGHHVVSTGPYTTIRHPGYAGGIISTLASPFLLDSVWGIAPAVCYCVTILVRTHFEDATLQKELKGYAEYARKVRFRIFPGIW